MSGTGKTDKWLGWQRLRARQVRLPWLLGRDETMSVAELVNEAPSAFLLIALLALALLI